MDDPEPSASPATEAALPVAPAARAGTALPLLPAEAAVWEDPDAPAAPVEPSASSVAVALPVSLVTSARRLACSETAWFIESASWSRAGVLQSTWGATTGSAAAVQFIFTLQRHSLTTAAAHLTLYLSASTYMLVWRATSIAFSETCSLLITISCGWRLTSESLASSASLSAARRRAESSSEFLCTLASRIRSSFAADSTRLSLARMSSRIACSRSLMANCRLATIWSRYSRSTLRRRRSSLASIVLTSELRSLLATPSPASWSSCSAARASPWAVSASSSTFVRDASHCRFASASRSRR